jgi:hypothetical protein
MLALSVGCGNQADSDTPTYYGDAKVILDSSCATCHQEGGIAPFALETLEQAVPYAALIRSAVQEGTMPPWQAADNCNDYANDFSLSDADKATLLDWVDGGAPAGDPTSEQAATTESDFAIDLLVTLPEPFTPQTSPDDYRCQLIDWPETAPTYVTGIRVEPDEASMVHHTIVYAVSAEQAQTYRDLDDAQEGPGYTCFGGPTGESDNPYQDLTTEELLALMASAGEGESPVETQRWLGAWVPGVATRPFPAGTGLRMEPDDVLIVQMHYNTDNAHTAADQSSIGFRLADTVERQAVVKPLTDLGWVTEIDLLGEPMTIPAGEASVHHSTTITGTSMFFSSARGELGLEADAPMVVHTVGHHMHQLGHLGRQELRRTSGENTCLVDIPDWDFHWQGSFALAEPLVFNPEDEIWLSCDFDNSQANQPIIDGTQMQSQDLAWGEGSTDEMCLSTVYLTAP